MSTGGDVARHIDEEPTSSVPFTAFTTYVHETRASGPNRGVGSALFRLPVPKVPSPEPPTAAASLNPGGRRNQNDLHPQQEQLPFRIQRVLGVAGRY